MLSSICATCGSKKSRFMKKQEVSGLLSNLGIKTPLSKIPFWVKYCFNDLIVTMAILSR